MALNLYLQSVKEDNNLRVKITSRKSKEEVQAELNHEYSKCFPKGYITAVEYKQFKAEASAVLQVLAFKTDLCYTLNEFATMMFEWGRRFGHEELRAQLDKKHAASDQSA